MTRIFFSYKVIYDLFFINYNLSHECKEFSHLPFGWLVGGHFVLKCETGQNWSETKRVNLQPPIKTEEKKFINFLIYEEMNKFIAGYLEIFDLKIEHTE